MIDFEAEFFTMLKRRLKIDGSTIEQDNPPSLPYFAFEMLDNPVTTTVFDGDTNKFASPKFRVTVYTDFNDKEAAKKYLTEADQTLSEVGLIRSIGPQKVASTQDNVCKMISVYNNNIIDKDGNVYRR